MMPEYGGLKIQGFEAGTQCFDCMSRRKILLQASEEEEEKQFEKMNTGEMLWVSA